MTLVLTLLALTLCDVEPPVPAGHELYEQAELARKEGRESEAL
jgi:hypothetical protein